jgi:SAM-dependent methyltransferase
VLSELEQYYLQQASDLLAVPAFRERLEAIDFGSAEQNRQTTEQKFRSYVNEAALIVSEIMPHVELGKRLLEIGGGIGLVYIWLRRNGCDIHSIEPSGSRHNGYYEIGQILMQRLGVDPAGWLNLEAASLSSVQARFDVIFSHNVVEHLLPMAENFAAMREVLAPGGMMLHQFPNYTVPYDPHFGIPLVPLRPQATARLIPRLRNNPLWQSLNFISTLWLKQWCRASGLEFRFKRGHWFASVERLKTDDEFRIKHGFIFKVFQLMEALGLNAVLKKIPDHLTTPVQVIIRKP